MEIYGYAASIIMGLSLGLIGGGGSILTVPILVYMFSVEPILATSNSLFIVGSTALVGSGLAFRRNEVDFKTGFLFAIPSFVGVFLTKKILVPNIPEVLLSTDTFKITKPLFIMAIFATLMLLASTAMIRKKKNTTENSNLKNKNLRVVAFQGLLVGGVTGLVGAGGGFLIVPALVNLVGLNMRLAIGTSLTIIAANSLFGFTVSALNGGQVPWTLLLTILLFALLGLVVGSLSSRKVPEQKLKTGFGYFVLIMGAIILFDQIRRL